jgi:hypothetical protein
MNSLTVGCAISSIHRPTAGNRYAHRLVLSSLPALQRWPPETFFLKNNSVRKLTVIKNAGGDIKTRLKRDRTRNHGRDITISRLFLPLI